MDCLVWDCSISSVSSGDIDLYQNKVINSNVNAYNTLSCFNCLKHKNIMRFVENAINSLRLSDAYMSVSEPSLVQILACHLVGTKPNQCWNIVNLNLRNKLQWNFNRNHSIFIQENAFESVVCKMAAILSRPQCVKTFNLQRDVFPFPNQDIQSPADWSNTFAIHTNMFIYIWFC